MLGFNPKIPPCMICGTHNEPSVVTNHGYCNDCFKSHRVWDSPLPILPSGWTLARVTENDDKSWSAEAREGFLTSYSNVVITEGVYKHPSEAIQNLIDQIWKIHQVKTIAYELGVKGYKL